MNLKHGEHRCVGGDNDDPDDSECHGRVADVAYRHGGDGVNHSQIAIKRHQHECVDASMSRHVRHILIYLYNSIQLAHSHTDLSPHSRNFLGKS